MDAAAARLTILAIVVVAALPGCRCGPDGTAEQPAPPEARPRLVVVGVDGLDPDILEDLVGGKELPNLARLHRARVGTTTPSDPRVAWTSLVTGTPPAAHGLVGEVMRLPSSLEFTELAFVRDKGGGIRSLRAGEPFWVTVSRHARRVRVLRAPDSFPALDVESGEVLSGPGTPDLRGEPCTYFVVRSAGAPGAARPPDGGILLEAGPRSGGGFEVTVPGPRSPDGTTQAALELHVEKVRGGSPASLRIASSGHEVVTGVGQWSEWIEILFQGPGGQIPSITRVLPLALTPELEVFLEPPGADPYAPVFALSTPRYYAGFLADRYGRFRTTGQVVDERAHAAGVIDMTDLLRQTYLAWEEQERMTIGELGRGGWDLFFVVFPQPGPAVRALSATDDEIDAQNLEKIYSRLDGMVGEIMKGLRASDRLIVVSARGTRPVTRTFNLTAWLVKERYMCLERKAKSSPKAWLADVDWQSTRAYSAGAGFVYLNLAGREPAGTVEPGQEADRLAGEIRSRLLALRDGERHVVKEVLAGDELFAGPASARAPDLVVVLGPGYGIGPGSQRGAVPSRVLEDSTRPAAGGADGGDASDARGILLSTLPVRSEPVVVDVAPTVLAFFGIKPPPSYTGRNLW